MLFVCSSKFFWKANQWKLIPPLFYDFRIKKFLFFFMNTSKYYRVEYQLDLHEWKLLITIYITQKLLLTYFNCCGWLHVDVKFKRTYLRFNALIHRIGGFLTIQGAIVMLCLESPLYGQFWFIMSLHELFRKKVSPLLKKTGRPGQTLFQIKFSLDEFWILKRFLIWL